LAVSVPKRALQRAVKVSAVAADRVRRPQSGVVVLVYHRIGGGTGLEIDLPVPVFERQVEHLARSGRVVPLAVAIDQVTGRAPAGGDPAVVLTFDDGTADFTDVAVPILARYGLPATLYVATAYIEERIPFSDGGDPCSWGALADACATGLVDVGSHTHRHRLLDRLAPAEIDDELDRSIGLVRDRLGRDALDFAYPKAVPGSAEAERAVRRRFRSAALAGTRPNVVAHTDPWRLARSPIQVADGMTWFRHKVAGGMALEDRLRRALNRRRYAGAIS
jgi:peptidoglycan/xylan/chitin deacetylase (PgdA/CDA1 family)